MKLSTPANLLIHRQFETYLKFSGTLNDKIRPPWLPAFMHHIHLPSIHSTFHSTDILNGGGPRQESSGTPRRTLKLASVLTRRRFRATPCRLAITYPHPQSSSIATTRAYSDELRTSWMTLWR
ncbi:hypothetical protein E2C01_054281 [Portunus trituberculatus]|uniref:Uncharacterized protein n=1 Tax=Portunus trituberculatus TaxID=210409 RepID=A0A5B7GN17_PORTR|nr:hypothetical protein [Portunus trituberculatus]